MPLQGRTKKNIIIGIVLFILILAIYVPLKYIREYGAVAAFRPSVRTVESGFVSYKTSNFSQVESNNFVVKYEDVDEEVINLVIKTAEDKYSRLVDIFNYKFNDKIEIIVYNDVNKMMSTTMLRGNRAPMGVYFGNSIHIYNPIYWINEDEDMHKVFYYEGPVLHELAHKFTDHIGRGNFPTWFTEGVSLYLEYMVDGYEWGVGLEVDEQVYSIENLTNNFYALDVHTAYTQSFRFVRGYVERNGIESLIELIDEIGKGNKVDLKDFKS